MALLRLPDIYTLARKYCAGTEYLIFEHVEPYFREQAWKNEGSDFLVYGFAGFSISGLGRAWARAYEYVELGLRIY